jgi:hypothetical protein
MFWNDCLSFWRMNHSPAVKFYKDDAIVEVMMGDVGVVLREFKDELLNEFHLILYQTKYIAAFLLMSRDKTHNSTSIL